MTIHQSDLAFINGIAAHYLRFGEAQPARNLLELSATIDCSYRETWSLLAEAYYRTGDAEMLEYALSTLERMEPERRSSRLGFLKAAVFLLLGRPAEARVIARQFIPCPRNPKE